MGRGRAAVIGSGFGGLALAIRLQAAGLRTVLFEKRDQPGGRAYVYRDEGFTFDAGPTVITAPECLSDLFELAGRKIEDYVEMLPVMPFYRLYWEDGYEFDYSNDLDATLAQIEKKSPRDVKGYLRFLDYTAEVFAEGYTKLAHVPFLNWWSMVRVSPKLLRLQSYRSVYSMVARHIKEPHLRQAFSFHSLLVGGNPFTTSSIYTLIHFLERNWGVYFPKGGTGALVQGLIRLFEELGGEVRLGAEVERIETSGGRVSAVVARGGAAEPFDLVASNADVMHTVRDLLRGEPRAEATRRRLERMRYSMSLFLVYFGTRRRYPHLAHHNVLFGPRYRELLQDIFETGRLAKDFSLYLHMPTLTDPSMAPPGCEAFYVLSPVPHLGKCSVDWAEEGPRYADRILAYLEKQVLPDLRANLVTRRIFTPQDFKTELNAHLGAAFSLEPILRQSAYFRLHNRDDRVEGLYWVGAGTHPGAGVPGVVNSARATAGLMIEDARTRGLEVA
jgi:phytoene desaturase